MRRNRLRAGVGRTFSSIVRSRDLQVAAWAFRDTHPDAAIYSRRLFGGVMQLDVTRSQMHQLLYLIGPRLVPEARLIAQLLGRGMTAVDVGANIGYYLLLFEALIGSTGRVICIEPGSENLTELKRNVAANRFRNVEIHETAAGARSGVVDFRNAVNGRVEESHEASPTVRIERLDSILRQRVDLIKIDVEGYEMQVIDGAVDVLRRDRPMLFVEVHPQLLPRFGSSAGDVLARLRDVYRWIEAWEAPSEETTGAWRKICARYFGVGRVERRDVADVASARNSRTFWLICRP